MQVPQDPRKSSPPIPEMVAATSAPFYIGSAATQISLPMHPPTGPALLRADPSQRRVSIRIENITCNRGAPSFDVYLNVPAGGAPEQHPELQVGTLGLFGLVQMSDPKREHGGSGMSFNLDVTDVFNRLAAMTNWDPQNLRVSFVHGFWETPVPQVKVGRVSVYFR